MGMKVVYILPTSVGGLPHYVAELANAVANYANVTVIKPIKTTADNIFSNNVKIVNAFKPFIISFASLAKGEISFTSIKNIISYNNINVIGKINPDIIHFAADLPPILEIFTYLHKLDVKYRTVVTFHDYIPRRSIILRRGRELLADAPFLTVIAQNINNLLNLLKPEIKIDGIIVHSKKTKEKLIKSGVSRRVYVIPHGVYTFFRELNHARSIKEENNCILFFGNICPVKGLDTLIKAIPIIAKKIPDVKLIIAGDGVIPKKNWQIIEKYKSNFEIHNYFIPNEEVGKFFSRACIVVIPNRRQEGHSGSLTVAYSFGKPVVTTNVGEFPILVKEAGCGLVVPPENPKALAEAIIKLLRDENLRKKMSKNALKMAEKLSWDNIAKMHIKVYEEVLNERRSRS
ncbi:MAG: sugar transferase [Archaeoglobales archaeon]|nr:MAG: sugar transferase [Archaeoglobales archaeon]